MTETVLRSDWEFILKEGNSQEFFKYESVGCFVKGFTQNL